MLRIFSRWMSIKEALHIAPRQRINYKPREIWWVSIGMNIGAEEYGKGSKYRRPVLIVRGFNKQLFWGVPLSTTSRRGTYYYEFICNQKISVALLSQLRTFDTLRFGDRYGTVSQSDFDTILLRLRSLLS